MKDKTDNIIRKLLRTDLIVRGYFAIFSLVGMLFIMCFLFFTRSCRENNEVINTDTTELRPPNYAPISSEGLDSLIYDKINNK
jgi:hypothetical protein